MKPLDSKDRKILNLLQTGNMCTPKVHDIAKALKMSPSAVFNRIKKLENEGIIKKYTVIIDPEKIDKGFAAYMLGQAQLGADADFDKIGETLSKIPGIQEVHFVTGDWDFIIKLRLKDQKEYYEVTNRIAKSGISRGCGMVVPKTFKESTVIDI